ncbi:MAG TPA: hypothetical protein VK524_27605 [Polyangiaceae bacterium]|nr:hypothetical protein [Polyangiaceae bacterium]
MTTTGSISSRQNNSNSLTSNDEGVGGVCGPPPPDANLCGSRRSQRSSSSDELPLGARYLLANASKPKLQTAAPGGPRGEQVEKNKDAYNEAIHSRTQHFPGGTVVSEIGSLKGDIGTHNPDGSKGIYVSLQANIAQSEWTFTNGAEQTTVGLSAGLGFELGIGTRDIDSDGLKEHCRKVSVGPLAFGQCIEEELPDVQERNRSGPTSGAEGGRGY